MRKIIGISGIIGSGKGTVGDILINKYNFTKISFADKLKDGVATLFDWDRALLEGDTTESRIWRETSDTFWTNELGYDITPRLVLQLFGTECMRKGFNNDFWVHVVKQELMKNPDTNYVLPDTRFYNEQLMLASLNGELWQIKNNSHPAWIDDAISDNTYETSFMSQHDIHESEWKWCRNDEFFDQIIHNTGTITDLDHVIDKAIKSRTN